MCRVTRECSVAVACGVLLASHAVAQQTLVVDSLNRPGTTHLDIGPAFAAARNGDTILVRAGGTYGGGTLGVGATVVAQPGTVAAGNIVVSRIPANQRVTISGLQLISDAQSNGSLRVLDCLGPVVLERITNTGLDRNRNQPALDIARSASVSANACTFYAATANPVSCTSSSVALTGSTVSNNVTFVAPGAALGIYGSQVVISGGTIRGHDAVCYSWPPGCLPQGLTTTPAIEAKGSSVVACGGAGVTGGAVNALSCNTCASQAPGVVADAATTIYRDPSCTFTVSGPAAIASTIPALRATGVPPAQNLTLALTSSAGAPYATLLSLPVPMQGYGPTGIWLDPASTLLVESGQLAVGQRLVTLAVPALVPVGLPIVFQSALLVGGNVICSAPVSVSLF